MTDKDKKRPEFELICQNKRAGQRYVFEDKFEAGLVLQGSEVKSLRAHRADLDGAYAEIGGKEAWIHHMHIAEFPQAGPHHNHEPKRTRKLLMHRGELEKIRGRLTSKGYTLVPLRLYFKKGFAKVELALAKGKEGHDKRDEIKRDLSVREARDAMKRTRQ